MNRAFINLGFDHTSLFFFFLLNDGIKLSELFLRLVKGASDCVVIVHVHVASSNYPCKLIN